MKALADCVCYCHNRPGIAHTAPCCTKSGELRLRTPREEARHVIANDEGIAAAIESARAAGVIEAYAALPSVRARFTVAEIGDSLAVAAEALSISLDAVSKCPD